LFEGGGFPARKRHGKRGGKGAVRREKGKGLTFTLNNNKKSALALVA